MINTSQFEEINKITDPIDAAKRYLRAVSLFRDNCETDINEIIFDDLAYRFTEKWAEIVSKLPNESAISLEDNG